jgi:hypothetical protein
MPDDFSLTGTSILNKVPKQEMAQVCKIKPKDYWNENIMGKVATFGNKKIIALQKKLKSAEENYDRLMKSYTNCSKLGDADKVKKCQDRIQKQLNSAENAVKKYQDQIDKLKHDVKEYRPNAFLFGDEADETKLLTPEEEKQLIRNKLKLEKDFEGRFTQQDLEKERNQYEKEAEGLDTDNPLDFIEEPKNDEEKLTEFEKFIREREQRREERDTDSFNFRNR